MKIVLVMGNYEKQGFPPLGILSLAAYLEQYNPTVEIDVYDAFPNEQTLLKINPDIVAFSALSVQYPVVSEYAKHLREQYKGLICVGGVHISLTKVLPEWADIGIIGEGEETVSEMVAHLEADGYEKLKAVRGLIIRIEGKDIFTGKRPYIKNLDMIPYPAFHKIDMSSYLLKNNVYGTTIGRGLSIITTRGCAFHCDYCSASEMWHTIRYHSAKYIVKEIQRLIEIYQIQHLWIADDHFATNYRRLEEMASLFDQYGIHISMGINTRVDAYNSKIAMILRRLGVRSIAFGLETGSDRLLRQIKHRQNLTVEKEISIVEQAANDGFEIHGMFMLNIPGETRDELYETVDMIKRLPLAKCSVSIATPFYGTKWWDIAVAERIVPEKPTDDYWSTYSMKTLEKNRPIYRNEVSREELMEVYADLNRYCHDLFDFDWRNRGNE